MDYDDNDFQGQNLHLAGEGSSKFSPVLRPYSLPKFDFDDGLQSHLRFDSLVENEVFLGIPSQEDNHWIEDFSRGSSVIEFSTSAAESCSISRCNNDWSEATLSESVEMLLKSVGQEQKVPGETIIKESDACHELGNLTDQMEPHMKQDEEVKDKVNSETVLESDKLLEHISRLNDAERTSQTQETEISTHESSRGPSPNSSGETYDVFMKKCKTGIDSKCDNENQIEVNTSVNESIENRLQKDSSCPGMQIGDTDLSSQAITVHAQESENLASDGSFEIDAGELVGKRHGQDKEVDLNDQNLVEFTVETGSQMLENHPSSNVKPPEHHKTDISNFEKPSILPVKVDENLQRGDGNDGLIHSSKPDKRSEYDAIINPIEIHEQFKGDMHKDVCVAIQSDNNLEGHAIEVSDVEVGISASSEQTVNHANPTTDGENNSAKAKYNLQGINHQLNSEASVSNAEASLVSGMCNKVSHEHGGASGGNYVGDNSGFTVACSASEVNMEEHFVENLSVNDAFAVQREDINAEGHVVFPMVAGTEQKNIFSDPSDVHVDQLTSSKAEVKAKFPNDFNTTECQIIKSFSSDTGVEPSSQEGNMKANDAAVDRSEDDTTTMSGAGASENKVLNNSNQSKKTDDGTLTETKSERKPDSILEIEKDASHNSDVELSHGVIDQSLPVVGTCNLARASEQFGELPHKIDGQSVTVLETSSTASQSGKAVKENAIGEKSSSKLEVCFTFHDSTAKPDACAEEIVAPGNVKEAAMRKNLEVASSEAADSVLVPKLGEVLQKPTVQAGEVSMIVSGSPSTPGVTQTNSKLAPEISHGSSQVPDKETVGRGSKGISERKTKRASGKSTGKKNTRKGNRVKETTPLKQSERGDKSHAASMSLAGTSQLLQFEGMKPYGNVEHSAAVPCGVMSTSTSSLPDLNTSAPSSALFQQPFTDLQQVQLRAQIFVYGSLIQGVAPDESYMVSAFGTSDGGWSVWEPNWRACVERLQGQKSHPSKSGSPVQPLSGSKPSDQTTKQGKHQSKELQLPIGQESSKGISSPAVNSVIPLSSPLWNIPTASDSLQSTGIPRSGLLDYHQTISPLHTFQTPPLRSLAGHTTSWLSRAPFPVPWVAPPQTSAFDASTRLPAFPLTETVKLIPVKESSTPVSSGLKHASPSPAVLSAGPGVLVGNTSLPDMKEVGISSGKNSADPKASKRKKVAVSENFSPISFIAQTRTESISAPVISSHLSTSVVVSTPAYFESKGDTNKNVLAVSGPSLSNHLKSGEQDTEQKSTQSEDTLSKIEEAKQQAENASALAAAAANYSQNVWNQLDKYTNSGCAPDVETKLASAAISVAAAASVAKAAAAAAKIASNAALQAKLMADEAFVSSGMGNPAQNNGAYFSDFLNSSGKATPASIWKAGDGSNASSSVIVAAREASGRKVEAASAASKRAENLDAIVKAAELAADAVSQVGKIVAMDDPFPLNELVKAGPEGYWRVPLGVKLNDSNQEQPKVHSVEGLDVAGRAAKEGLKKAKTTNHGFSPLSKEVYGDLLGGKMGAVDGMLNSLASIENDSRGLRSCRASDVSKTIGVIPESEIGSKSVCIAAQGDYKKCLGTSKGNGIKEGCLVEVFKAGDGLKVAWYSATVLCLNEGKAFVCYQDLQSEDGSSQLKEWVELKAEGNNAPQIRLPHPVRLEGTRKRPRAAMGDFTWTIGDRVDVWMQDCWREGVVTEKNRKDETALTVHFPAEGETSVVKAWHLRPTLIWKDGEWIGSFGFKEGNPSSQGDSPQEKRLKLVNYAIEGRKGDYISSSFEPVGSGRREDSQLLSFPANEKIFNVGKNSRNETKPNALRTARTGLQIEGSRVIFGVPKPGKKRKFMEVSKHYVADKTSKINESNDSVKFANCLVPLESGSRGWDTKIDAKEKQPDESWTKFPKSGKTQSVLSRKILQKDDKLTSLISAPNEDMGMGHVIKESISTVESETSQQMGFGSFSNTEGAADGPVLFSSQALPFDAPSKKDLVSNAKFERVTRGKQPPSAGKPAKVEVKDKVNNSDEEKLISEFVEPRRSNRRIQPTSRLLEGLQSSLIISKIPAASHEKSNRSQSRGASKGSNHS